MILYLEKELKCAFLEMDKGEFLLVSYCEMVGGISKLNFSGSLKFWSIFSAFENWFSMACV
jgi:hypothetical protein